MRLFTVNVLLDEVSQGVEFSNSLHSFGLNIDSNKPIFIDPNLKTKKRMGKVFILEAEVKDHGEAYELIRNTEEDGSLMILVDSYSFPAGWLGRHPKLNLAEVTPEFFNDDRARFHSFREGCSLPSRFIITLNDKESFVAEDSRSDKKLEITVLSGIPYIQWR